MLKDTELHLIIDFAIKDLEHAVKNFSTEDLYNHIGSQLQLIHRINRQLSKSLFDYIENQAPFDELYHTENLIFAYNNWLFSPLKPEAILKLLDRYDVFECEKGIFTIHARNAKSLSDFWFTVKEACLHQQVGLYAAIRISLTTAQRPERDWLLYNNIGQFRKIMFMDTFGPPSISDKKIFEIFRKVRTARNIPLPDKISKKDTRFDHKYRSDIPTDYDQAAAYLKEVVENIRSLDPKEALKQLCEGCLYKYTKNRADDRLKDSIRKAYAQKRGGRSPEEIGTIIRKQRQEQGLTIPELAKASGKSGDWIKSLEQGKEKNIHTQRVYYEEDLSKWLLDNRINIPNEGHES